MKDVNGVLGQTIGISFSIAFFALAVSAWGAVIENVYMANFWYLAFCAIVTFAMACVATCLILVFKRVSEWYRRLLCTWDGYVADT